MKSFLAIIALIGAINTTYVQASPETDKQRSLIAYMLIESGQQEQFLKEAEQVITDSRKESGNITYQLHQSSSNPQLFMFYELFHSQEDLTYHRNAPHTKAFLAKTKPYTLKFGLEEYQLKEGR